MPSVSSYYSWQMFMVSVAGLLVLGALVRLGAKDRTVLKIVAGSYLVRVVVGILFFSASYWNWPFLEHLQIGRGFWHFSPDATGYHMHAKNIIASLQMNIPILYPRMPIEYYVIVASVYKLLGANPLYPIFLNCWAASLNGFFIYLIAKRLFDSRAAKVSCFLACFWPSSLLWTTQIVKDPVCWVLFSFTALLVVMILQLQEGSPNHKLKQGALLVLLALATAVLTRIRPYLGISLSVAGAATMIWVVGHALFQKRMDGVFRTAVVAGVIMSSMLIAKSVNLYEVLSPPPPAGMTKAEARAFVIASLKAVKEASKQKASPVRMMETSEMVMEAGETPNQEAEAPALAVASLQAVKEASKQKAGPVHIMETSDVPDEAEHLSFTQTHDATKSSRTYPKTPFRREIVTVAAEPQRREAPRTHSGTQAEKHKGAPRAARGYPGSVTGRQARLQQEEGSGIGSNEFVLTSSLIVNEIQSTVDLFDLVHVNHLRKGFISTGGNALIDEGVQISDYKSFLRYIPRAAMIAYLAPFPRQWFNVRGSTGVMRILSGIEMILFYPLLCFAVWNIGKIVKRGSPEAIFVIVFILFLSIAMAVVIANFGTLFRLRLQFILPLLIFVGRGWLSQCFKGRPAHSVNEQ